MFAVPLPIAAVVLPFVVAILVAVGVSLPSFAPSVAVPVPSFAPLFPAILVFGAHSFETLPGAADMDSHPDEPPEKKVPVLLESRSWYLPHRLSVFYI